MDKIPGDILAKNKKGVAREEFKTYRGRLRGAVWELTGHGKTKLVSSGVGQC